jgi:hypothetical protein
MTKSIEKAFWVSNISNRNVTLADLYISVPARASVNLLDARHYGFTEEQLRKSAESGSLFVKRDKVVVRKVPPMMIPKRTIEADPNAVIPTRSHSTYEIKQEHYEELEVGDESLLDDGPIPDQLTTNPKKV